MNCPDCKDKLDRYLDRELNNTEVMELQLHLEGCPDCSDQYEFHAHLKRLVTHSCDCRAAPAAFRQKLRQLLSSPPRGSTSSRPTSTRPVWLRSRWRP